MTDAVYKKMEIEDDVSILKSQMIRISKEDAYKSIANLKEANLSPEEKHNLQVDRNVK